MRFAVLNEIVDQQNRNEENGDLETIEVQVHVVLAHDPTDNNDKRKN